MMNKKAKYKLLIHCRIPQIREGFEVHIDSLGFPVNSQYADLSQDGILSKLKFAPNLIIVLLGDSDSDMLLPIKLKMFAAHTPIIWITPAIPEKYEALLQTIGIDEIIQLPDQRDCICTTISNLLQLDHGLP